MKGRRETLVMTTAAVVFGLVFGILLLACGQSEEQPDARAGASLNADTPASAEAEPDLPPAPSASKVTAAGERTFDDTQKWVRDLGKRIEIYRGEATGDLEPALEELEATQAQLMAELEAIGGENEKWDAARAEFIQRVTALHRQIRQFARRAGE
jgi:hypothetical protein